jgi:hypothetical protein
MRGLETGFAPGSPVRSRLLRSIAIGLAAVSCPAAQGRIGAALLLLGVGCAAAPPVTASSDAAQQPRVVATSYRAPLGCPSGAEYADYVARRSALLRLDPLGALSDSPERVRVQIRADPNSPGWIGELYIEGESPLEREVHGDRCQDVAVALALITVLRLEPARSVASAAGATPDSPTVAAGAGPATGAAAESRGGANTEARSGSAAEPAPSAAPEPAPSTAAALAPSAAAKVSEPPASASSTLQEPASDSAPVDTTSPSDSTETRNPTPTSAPSVPNAAAPAAAPPSTAAPVESDADRALAAAPFERRPASELRAAPAPQAPAESSAETEAPTPELSTEATGSTFQFAPVLVGSVGYASAPSQAFKAALGAELRLGPDLESWAAAFAVAYSRGAQRSSSGDLSLQVIAAELELCPFARALGERLWLRVCGEVGAGALSVSASEREIPLAVNSTLRPWLVLGPSAQLGFPLTEHFALRAAARLSLALVRDRFEVERAASAVGDAGARFTLYRPPALSADLLLGAAYAF